MKSLSSSLLILLLLLLSSSLLLSNFVDCKTVLSAGTWTNFTLTPTAMLGINEPTFLFVPNTASTRGDGVLLYTRAMDGYAVINNGGVYGANIGGYRFGGIYPQRPDGPNTQQTGVDPNIKYFVNGSKLTLDGGQMICPEWYSPPPDFDIAFNSLADAALNQTVSSQRFHMLGNAITLDHQNRLIVHSNIMQMLIRMEATTPQIAAVIDKARPASPDAPVGDFTMSVLWGDWCNGTHLPFTNRNYQPLTDPPPNGVLTLTEVLERYVVGMPNFLTNGAVIFTISRFQCIFYTGPDLDWRVIWWLGNCSVDPLSPDTPTYVTPRHRTQSASGRIVGLLVDLASNSAFVSDNYRAIRRVDLITGMVTLVMGNTTAPFHDFTPRCDKSTSCSPTSQPYYVHHMAVAHNAMSPVDGKPTTMLFAIDYIFSAVYAVDLRNNILITELILDYSPSDPYDPDQLMDCRPRQIAASPADLYILCHDGNTVFRRRYLPFDQPPEPVVAIPQIEAISMTAVTAFTTISAFVGLPTVAVTAGRLRSMIALARCEVTMDKDTPLPWVESPTQLSIGATSYRYYAGAIIGNVILIIVPMIIHYIVVRIVTWRTIRKAEALRQKQISEEIQKHQSIRSPDGIDLTAFLAGELDDGTNPHHAAAIALAKNADRVRLQTEAKLRYPSASFVFMFMFTIEPTVRSSTFLMRFADPHHPDNAQSLNENDFETRAEFAIGIVGLILSMIGTIAVAVFFGYFFTAVFFPIADDETGALLLSPESAEVKIDTPRADGLPLRTRIRIVVTNWYRRWKRFSKPFGEWRDHRNEQASRFGGLIKPYTERGRWWSVAEIISTGGLAALTGFKTQETCIATAAITVAVLWIFFIAILIVRPMASRFDNFFYTLIAGLSAFSGFFALSAAIPIGSNQDYIHTSTTLSETLALAALFLIGILAFFDIANRVFKILKFLVSNICCPASDDEGKTLPLDKLNDPNNKYSPPHSGTINSGRNDISPIVIDTTPLSDGNNNSKPTIQLNLSFDLPKESALNMNSPMNSNGGMGRQYSSSSGSTGRTASDADLLETVARHINKANKRAKINVPGGADITPRASNAPQFPSSVGTIDSSGHLLPPGARASHNTRSSSNSSSSMATFPNSETSSQNNNHNSASKNAPAPNARPNYGDYVLDDSSRSGSSNTTNNNGENDVQRAAAKEEKRKQRTMMMEYEIMRAELQAELDTGVKRGGSSDNNSFSQASANNNHLQI